MAILFVAGALLGACGTDAPQKKEKAVSAEMRSEHEARVQAWHEERLDRLREEGSWLTLVGLFWLHPGGNAVGSDAGNPVVLPSSTPGTLGSLRLEADSDRVTFVPADGESVEVDGQSVDSPLTLASDLDEGGPTTVRVGTVSFYVIGRDGRVGVRVKDSASEIRAGFEGIERFPVSWDWRVTADYTPRERPKRVEIPTALGTVSQMGSPGRIRFQHSGQTFELDAFETGDPQEVWFVFGDRTNGKSTYGGGRFLYARFDEGGPSEAGPLVVDFNRSYNPPCVFTPYATCPLPTSENRLALAVEAGEKVWGDHHDH